MQENFGIKRKKRPTLSIGKVACMGTSIGG
jgi:hypothetical protein